jgi:eukaryotic-like serine/threonine-protein kinase
MFRNPCPKLVARSKSTYSYSRRILFTEHPPVYTSTPAVHTDPRFLHGITTMPGIRRLGSDGVSASAERDIEDRDPTTRFRADAREETERDIELPRDGIIDGRYQVVDRVGDGGMGVVLRAQDLRLHRQVALKLIRPHLVAERELVEQFLAEARAMAQLRHPNVVEVHDFGEHQGRPYFVMRFVDGPDLHSWVGEQPLPLPVDVALGVLGQICEGVAAIHDAGVVHRDIKPENMLVDAGFRVVVTDFGLVRPLEELATQTGWQVAGGTAAYMAPELAREDDLPPSLATRGDVYALGILAYWLLVGHHPFHARTRRQMLEMQIRARVPPPSEARPDLPRELDPVVLQALHKDPRRRTADARILADQLRLARLRIGRPRPRVVVVDEDEAGLRWIASTLADACPDAVVISLADSGRALERIEAEPPALVITALENEALSGLELAAMLRGNPTTQAVPVVVVSATGGAAEWQALWRIGVQGFLLKPLVREAFVPLVRGLLPQLRADVRLLAGGRRQGSARSG